MRPDPCSSCAPGPAVFLGRPGDNGPPSTAGSAVHGPPACTGDNASPAEGTVQLMIFRMCVSCSVGLNTSARDERLSPSSNWWMQRARRGAQQLTGDWLGSPQVSEPTFRDRALLDLIILARDAPKSDRVEVSIPLIGTFAPSWTVSTNCLC
jgi:hypothetical protein